MALSSNDRHELQSWDFLVDYSNHTADLLDLARDAFTTACAVLQTQPTVDQCVPIYAYALYHSSLFQGMVGRKQHLSPSFYGAFATKLARYVLNRHWVDINSPCP